MFLKKQLYVPPQATLPYIPRIITDRAMYVYMAVLLICAVAFRHYIMSWYWWLFGIVEVCGFFYYSNVLTKQWCNYPAVTFQKRLFKTSLIIRLVYVVCSYVFYQMMTGKPFEFGSADAYIYHLTAQGFAVAIRAGTPHGILDMLYIAYGSKLDLSDTGYPLYLGFVYLLTGNSILVARLLKALWSALTVVLVYKLAARTLGEKEARIAGIMCMLMPNLIYYCGIHLKETEMTFLIMLFVERADYIMRRGKLTFFSTVGVMLVATSLFAFRTVVGAVLMLAFLGTMIFSSTKVLKWGKRFLLMTVALVFIGVVVFQKTDIGNSVEEVWNTGGTEQKGNLEWRAQTNKFAKYAGAAVFAPMIFTIPFPSLVQVGDQQNQLMIHGGNYVKNILSGFTILALVLLLLSGDWRRHVLPLAVLCGYLVVLVFSNFAHSERFHLPVLPLLLMFAAYGITRFRYLNLKRSYTYWTLIILVAATAWNWFKLAGRGLI